MGGLFYFRDLIVVKALVAVSVSTHVAISLAAPAPDVATTSPQAESPEEPGDKSDSPPAGEELIAGALNAGTITYEDSLRQRTFALYDDPRLQPRFRSPLVNGEDEMRLFLEIDRKAPTLSRNLLTDLAPFRARPSDPISIFNRTPTKVAATTQESKSGYPKAYLVASTAATSSCEDEEFKKWKSRLVRGTKVKIWVKGSEADLKRFDTMVGMVWRAFPNYFAYPLDDDGTSANCVNPDSAIDAYFVHKGTAGLRETDPLTVDGKTRPAGPHTAHTSSGYILVDMDQPDELVLNTIAHELTHVSQMRYDIAEIYG